MSLRDQFLKGQYQQIVDGYDRGSVKALKSQVPWLAASLALMGRTDDALAIGRTDDPIAHFYVIVSLIRSSHYEKAERAMLDFFQGLRREDDLDRFYFYQSLGFRSFFEGRFKKALFWSSAAWQLALKVGGPNEKTLSSDLRGHSLIEMGQIEDGLESLERALELAKRFGNQSHIVALQSSIAMTEVEHGYRTDNLLREMLSGSVSLDSYTSTGVLTELARQANLRGQYREALKIAGETRSLVKVVRHRRQAAALAVREAYSHFRLGAPTRALEILVGAKDKLDDRDRAVLIQIEGLRLEILTSLGRPQKRLRQEVLNLALEVKSRRALSYAKRISETPVMLSGKETPVEKWMHGATDLHVRLELLDRGYLSFFENLLENECHNVVLLSLVPGRVLFRSRRELSTAEDGFSDVIRRGLLILAKSRRSKTEILELVWGYSYEASRHDTLIYTFIRRLRVALGPLGKLLTHSKADDTYGFNEPVSVKVLEFDQGVHPASTASAGGDRLSASYNLRQLEVLARLKAAHREKAGLVATSVSPIEIIRKFNVSRITATRDLAQLADRNLLVRTGSGRGTRYVLRESLNLF